MNHHGAVKITDALRAQLPVNADQLIGGGVPVAVRLKRQTLSSRRAGKSSDGFIVINRIAAIIRIGFVPAVRKATPSVPEESHQGKFYTRRF